MKKLIGVVMVLSLLLSGAAIAAHAFTGDADNNGGTLISDSLGGPADSSGDAGADVAGVVNPEPDLYPKGIAVGEMPMPIDVHHEGPGSGTEDVVVGTSTTPSPRASQSVCFLAVGRITACTDPPAVVPATDGDEGGSGGETSEGRDPQVEPEPAVFETITSIDDIDPNVCNMVHNITACESDAVTLAKEQVAELTGSGVDRIDVVDIEMAVWSAASLGVPQPNARYAHAETVGYYLNGNVVLAKETVR